MNFPLVPAGAHPCCGSCETKQWLLETQDTNMRFLSSFAGVNLDRFCSKFLSTYWAMSCLSGNTNLSVSMSGIMSRMLQRSASADHRQPCSSHAAGMQCFCRCGFWCFWILHSLLTEQWIRKLSREQSWSFCVNLDQPLFSAGGKWRMCLEEKQCLRPGFEFGTNISMRGKPHSRMNLTLEGLIPCAHQPTSRRWETIQNDKRCTVCQLAEEADLSKSSVYNMLKKDMKLPKITPKMIPKLLTDEQKWFWVQMYEINLASLRKNPNLMSTVVTGDKSWISVLEVETKQTSVQWLPKGTLEWPQKAWHQRAVRKSMLTLFFDVKGMVHSEILAPGETVISKSYCQVLGRLRESIQKKCPHIWGWVGRGAARPFLLHHDNALSHTAVPTLPYIREHEMEMLPHLPYSPDLAPCDYFIFPQLAAWNPFS